MVCFLVWLFGHEPPTGGFTSGDIVENSPELFFSTRRLVKNSPGLFRGNNPKGDRRLRRAGKMTTTWTTGDNFAREKCCYLLSAVVVNKNKTTTWTTRDNFVREKCCF